MASKQPNFIVFISDDQGYGDLSCMGCEDFRTPHLDRLAREGARCTNWYANSPVCSPSRASLLTGRYPGNAGVRSILAGHRTASGLPPQTPTLARALKDLGYATYMSGKWHLGLAETSRPLSHGFDHWFGFLAGCIDYYSHIFYWGMNKPGPGLNPTHDLWDDDEEVWLNGTYVTEAITNRAVDYLREASQADTPFVLYVAYNAPHYPMHAPQKYMDRFAHLPWDRQVMAAMLSAMDDGVGDIMAELDRLGLAENTCTMFMADNGPSRESRNWLDGRQDPYYGGSADGLKGHKFSLYEGGIRVPGIWHWPGRIPAGQVINDPCCAMDAFGTILSAAGGNPDDYETDGTNLLPLLCDRKTLPERTVFWEMGDQLAARRGPWKLVLRGQLVEGAPPEDEIHLANLDEDLSESVNLAEQQPEIVAELRNAVEQWHADIERRWTEEFDPDRQGAC